MPVRAAEHCYKSICSKVYSLNPIPSDATMVSYAHNQGGADDYYDKYADSVEQHLAKYCNTVVISVIQNPQTTKGSKTDG
jgi:hypothetical protein